MISGRPLVNSSRPSLIGASSDITRNGKPPSVTPTGYTHTYETARQSKASRAREPEPPTPITPDPASPPAQTCAVTSRTFLRGTKSLIHSLWVCPTHLPFSLFHFSTLSKRPPYTGGCEADRLAQLVTLVAGRPHLLHSSRSDPFLGQSKRLSSTAIVSEWL